MKIASTQIIPSVIVVIAVAWSQTALAEQFHVVNADVAQACQSGDKSEIMTLDAPTEIRLARADSDKLEAAVCLADNSKAAMQVTWKANGYWRNSGNISHDCAEVLGASKVLLRPIEKNFHGTATYYTCVKE